jgi:predicted Ser/Thr protein kinase
MNKINIGDIVVLRGTNQYGIVIKQENDGYIIDWFKLTFQDTPRLLYQASHLLKVSQCLMLET